MTNVVLTVNCCLCPAKHEAVVSLPENWQHLHGAIDDEQNGFCQEHAPVAAFAESQCPGCVGGWGDCPLWRAFAYTGCRDLGEDDFASLRRGICPRRVSGTMMVAPGTGLVGLNISERAPEGAGEALEAAIKDYWRRHS